MLAQHASSYDAGGRNFHIQEQPMHENLNFSRVGAVHSAKPSTRVALADSPSTEAKSAQPTPLLLA